LLIISLKIIVT